MFQLKGIKKDYIVGENKVNALKGIDLNFRDFEFVSILGPSGCGKTTLLNIIGGLDSYTEGDLLIDGVSTKDFKNRHWDNYRNHNVGFIFQSYNLINHQSVFSNVELSLVLQGASKEERKNRVLESLKRVGLENGFKREYRPYLKVMSDLQIELPILEDGTFDYELMRQWADYDEEVERIREELVKIISNNNSDEEP